MAFMNDFSSVFLVLGLARESEGVFRLSIGDLVNPAKNSMGKRSEKNGKGDTPEPLVGGSDQARKVSLDVLNIVELGCKRILDIDNDDFPVGLTLVQERHDTEDFDLFNLTNITDLFADLTNIERIVVTLGFSFSMLLAGIFPSLERVRMNQITNTC